MGDWNFIEIKEEAQKEISEAQNERALEDLRIKYLGRKGLLAKIYASFPHVSPERRPLLGKEANELKRALAEWIRAKQEFFKERQKEQERKQKKVDVTAPGVGRGLGHRHILTQTVEEICVIFTKLGFHIVESPEIETEFNNFTALNIPTDHPSRDAFDTFYLDAKGLAAKKGGGLLLRSHTSPGQIRVMKKYSPPIAVVVPGKVYRPDAVDASHSFMFHQIEGLLVDEHVTFADLKGLLHHFCKMYFGPQVKMRFRPHFFPFTEPSAEVDISAEAIFGKKTGSQARKQWLEIMGCGMVHPNVFEAVGYPKGKYTGLAFGMGVERIAMLKYGIDDIRIFFENDSRFLQQF